MSNLQSFIILNIDQHTSLTVFSFPALLFLLCHMGLAMAQQMLILTAMTEYRTVIKFVLIMTAESKNSSLDIKLFSYQPIDY